MAMEHAEVHADHHPGPRQYLIIGGILAALTGLEVGAFFLNLSSALVVFILLTLTAAKFVLVVAFFMLLPSHPKPTLRASRSACFFRGVLLVAHVLYHMLRVQLPKAV